MIKTFQFLFYFLFFLNFSYAQCSISDIVPFNLGDDKFNTTLILNKLSTIKNDEIYGSNTYSEWKKYPYLKNDSIYRVVINKRFNPNLCFEGSENRCQLYFADDKLYMILMSQEFKAEEYEKMIAKYNSIVNILSEIYPYSGGFKTTNIDTNEKIGEGYSFSDVSKENKPKVKVKNISVSYNITYKRIWNSYSKKYDKTSDIDYYEIKIEFVDLAGTKLTNKEY